MVQFWRSEKIEKGVLCVELKKGESKEEKTLNMEISTMIGIGLYQLQFANNDELDITRRKMVTYVTLCVCYFEYTINVLCVCSHDCSIASTSVHTPMHPSSTVFVVMLWSLGTPSNTAWRLTSLPSPYPSMSWKVWVAMPTTRVTSWCNVCVYLFFFSFKRARH